MARYAFVRFYYSDIVHRVLQIVQAEEQPTELPNDVYGYWVDVTENLAVQVGWKGTTTDFVEWIFSEVSYQDCEEEAARNQLVLLTDATNWEKLNPLQFKFDLGVATPEEQALLQAYKQYYVAVADVKKQTGYPSAINWPVAPF